MNESKRPVSPVDLFFASAAQTIEMHKLGESVLLSAFAVLGVSIKPWGQSCSRSRSPRLGWLAALAFMGFGFGFSGLTVAEPIKSGSLKSVLPTSNSDSPFLPPDQAFSLKSRETAAGLELSFTPADGYYLYRDRFNFSAEGAGLTLGQVRFPSTGHEKDDPTFGQVYVYDTPITLTLPVTGQGTVVVGWQGCAEAGLCYPPQTRRIAVNANSSVKNSSKTAEPIPAKAINPANASSAESSAKKSMVENASTASTTETDTETKAETADAAEKETNTTRPPSLWLILLAGLGLAFTPCVLPMLPILSGWIARQPRQSSGHGFVLALAYVLGVATVYAALGFAVGLLGQQINLAAFFQHPYVIALFAGIFFLLALSLFGAFELQLPAGLQSRLDGLSRQQRTGAIGGSFLIGVFSALVVSPCVSAPLVALLLTISTIGSAWYGASAMFVLALGMGLPLLLLGVTEGRLLPKAGAWMHQVKIFFGLLLIGVAAELLTRLVSGSAGLFIYGVFAAMLAVWLWHVLPMPLAILSRALGLAMAIYAGCLIVGGARGGDDPWRPLAISKGDSSSLVSFTPINTLSALQSAINSSAAQQKTVVVELYADWCVSCKVMERRVFRSPDVAAAMQDWQRYKVDVTEETSDTGAIMKHFGLIGPPTLLFFKNGQEIREARIVGEVSKAEFLAHLKQHAL